MDIDTIIMLTTQGSSILALLIGFVSLYYAYKAASKLVKGDFKNTISAFFVFLLVGIISIASMIIYHFNDSDLAESLWHYVMFAALLISAYESYKIIKLGKSLSGIENLARKIKKKKL